jgi:hypothetical protein
MRLKTKGVKENEAKALVSAEFSAPLRAGNTTTDATENKAQKKYFVSA